MALRSASSLSVLALALAAASLGGCASDSDRLKGAGAALPMAPVTGSAVSGGLIAGNVGNGLSDDDRRRAYDAEISALETGSPGYPVGWRGEGGTHGTVVAGPSYNRAGYESCRDYSHTIYIDNRPQIARGAACRAADGSWKPVG